MKILVFISFIFCSSAFACLCTNFIQQGFQNTQNNILPLLKAQISSLKKLKQNIEKVNTAMDEQNNSLDKQNNLLKDEIVRDSELIFYLKQKTQLR